MKSSTAGPLGGKIFLWLLILIGAWMVWSGLDTEGENPRRDWKRTTGKVLEVEKVEPMTDITGKRFTGPKGWDFKISYGYRVDGTYFRRLYSYHDPLEYPEPRYAADDRTTVYYDPASPANASLDDGYGLIVTKEMNRASVVSGSIMVAASAFFLALLNRKEGQAGRPGHSKSAHRSKRKNRRAGKSGADHRR